MSSKIEQLGRTVDQRINMVKRSNARPVCGLGSMGKKMNLLVDGMGDPIPKDDYSVCGNVAEKLKNGDRVLIVWCGNEPIIVDVIE